MLVCPDRVAPVCWPPPPAVVQPPVWPVALAYAAMRVAALVLSAVLWLSLLALVVTVPLLL